MRNASDLRSVIERHWQQRKRKKRPGVLLHEQTFGPEEILAILECLLEGRVTMGAAVRGFEAAFGTRFRHRHSVMVNSGSSANLLAISALANRATHDALRPGDEIIVPALSWSTTVWPLIQNGLVPVVVDIDRKTLNIDPAELERAIGPKTRGVMVVHIYGNPCDMRSVTDICRRRSLTLIEDCCEALGATYGVKHVGHFGRAATFSFYYSHHITTLEGGLCVTDDRELAELMRILRAHGWVREVERPGKWVKENRGIHPRFLFVNLGYNLRVTEPQGAMGLVQLPKLDSFIRTRTENATFFRKKFLEYDTTFHVQEETRGGRSSWFGLPIVIDKNAHFGQREITRYFEASGIETRPIVCGNIARQPGMRMYKHRVVGDLNNANHVMDAGFTFGIHQAVDEEARRYVADTLSSFMKSRRKK